MKIHPVFSMGLALCWLASCSGGEAPTGSALPSAEFAAAKVRGAGASTAERLIAAASGQSVSDARMRGILAALTRHVAVSLSKPDLRAKVWAELQASPYPEHKVELRRFLGDRGTAVLAQLAAVGGRSPAATLAAIDSMVSLEMYMPNKDHFRLWDGGPNLIVASQLFDGDAPVAFDLAGNAVPISAHQAPSTPTLVLVSSETDFTRPPAASMSLAVGRVAPADVCPYGTSGGVSVAACGGGISDPPTEIPPTPGIWMTHLDLIDDGEDNVFRGDPEIEVMFMGRVDVNRPDEVYRAAIAANESAVDPARRFDQNGLVWDDARGGYAGVLIASKAELDALRARFPGANPDSIPFQIAVWEDDYQRGEIADQGNQWYWAMGSLLAMTPAAANAIRDPGGINRNPWFAVLAGAGFIGLAKALASWQAQDDFLGATLDAAEYYRLGLGSTTRTHVLMKGSQRYGSIQLVYVK